MHHATETATLLHIQGWVYSFYSDTPERHNKLDYLSRLEISFLLDKEASSSPLKSPTYVTTAKLLNKSNDDSILL